MSYSEPIQLVSEESKLPNWWVESIALEYLDCREFIDASPPYKLNLSAVSVPMLKAAVQSNSIVIRDQLIHNVALDVFRMRALWRMFSSLPRPLALDDDDVFPNGEVSPHYFHWHPNSLDVEDPKTSLSRTFQVVDSGKLFQWRFANFEAVSGRGYGKWVSAFVDLTAFDALEMKHRELISGRSENQSVNRFRDEVLSYFSDLERERQALRGALLALHNCWKIERPNTARVAISAPPELSAFETYTVSDGKLKSQSSMAPLFFRACCAQCASAKSHYPANGYVAPVLSELYEFRATAIILGAACLESYLNEIGNGVLGDLWQSHYEMSLGVAGKIALVGMLRGDATFYDAGRAPFQSIAALVRRRNYLLHHKPAFETARAPAPGKQTVTVLAEILDRGFVDNLPNALRAAITALSNVAGSPQPAWLISVSDWTLPC